MKVKDLMEYLQSFNENDEVHLREYYGCQGEVFEEMSPLMPTDLSCIYVNSKYIIQIGQKR